MDEHIKVSEKKYKETEKRLKDPEEKYRFITESANDIISIINDNFELEYQNEEATYNILGYTNEEVLSQSALERIHPDEVNRVIKVFREGFKKGEAQAEMRSRHKDGHYVWFDIKGRTFIDEKGEKKGIIISRDITERKNTEQKLKESEERYRSLFENMNAAFAYHEVITDDYNKPIDYKFLEVNPMYEELTGLKAKDMIGKAVTEILPGTENDPADWIGKFGNVGLTGVPLSVEDYSEAIDRWYKVSGYSPKKGHFAITFNDITERKKAEQQIKISETKYRHLFDSSPDMIFLINMEGKIVDVNEKFISNSGYNKEDIIDKNFRILSNLTSPEALLFSIEKTKEIISKGYCKPVEFSFLDKNGDKSWISFQGHLIELGEENLIEYIVRDITARIEAQEKLKEAFERETFFKNLFTHNINIVLNNIQTSLSLYTLYQNNPEKQEEIRKIVNILKEQVVRGSHLVSNLRQLSDIEEDNLPLGSIDSAKVLEDAVKLVQEGFQSKIINVNINSPGDILIIQANELLINVFENILNNAVKYNEHSIVEIIIRITEQYDDGFNYMKFEFMDNGIGIDDLKKATIFKEGYKKEKGGKGLGFGLSLVKKIITGYKGRIWVEDTTKGEHEKGSNFVVLIPKN